MHVIVHMITDSHPGYSILKLNISALMLLGIEQSSAYKVLLILTPVNILTQWNTIYEFHKVTVEMSGYSHNGYVVTGSIPQTSQ